MANSGIKNLNNGGHIGDQLVSKTIEMKETIDAPISILENFMKNEKSNEENKLYRSLRLAGYVMSIGYDQVVVTTNDAFKKTVGGIPKNSFLVMVPEDYETHSPHFTLLRVLETAETPLSKDVQQTYFELHKRAMPELDAFTANELQWGALTTEVLGMFYQNPSDKEMLEFSGDMNNLDSPHRYKVYSPTDDLLNLIANALVPTKNRFHVGDLRLTECKLTMPGMSLPSVSVFVSTKDFMGTRTAMFGKTRLGKSNVIKIIAESLLDTASIGKDQLVGQLIFDIDGEYANDNPQDGSKSLKSAFPDKCMVYSFNPKNKTVRSLKLNFHEHPEKSLQILGKFLEEAKRLSDYIRNFTSAPIPSPESLNDLEFNEKVRAKRLILMYWAILKKSGFEADEKKLSEKLDLNPGFSKDLRNKIHDDNPPKIQTLDDLVLEFEKLQDFIVAHPDDPLLISSSGKPLLGVDDRSLLKFLNPGSYASGTRVLTPYRMYHDMNSGDTNEEIIDLLDKGYTVILDLSNSQPNLVEHYSEDLTKAVFRHQVEKFTKNNLGTNFIQMYFEEAHNLFPRNEDEEIDIYRRIAKEGAKYHIGMVYSTQSVTSINKDLLAQTENFFVTHLSSQDETHALARVNSSYENVKDDILKEKTVGFVKMLTRSHRFVVPVQIRKFEPKKLAGDTRQ